MVKLIDEAECRVTQITTRCLTQAGEILAVQGHTASARRIQPTQKMQQSRFSRAGGADDGYLLAGPDVDIDSLQHLHAVFALGEGLAQTATGEHGRCIVVCLGLHVIQVTHSAAPPPV